MSNQAYLIVSHDATPAGRNSDGDANYDERKDVLADGGSYQLPVFWLSLFSESDLCFHHIDDYRVSTLVCDRVSALDNLVKRCESVLAAFPGCEAHCQVWQGLVEGSVGAHFKVDATELWDMDPGAHERDLPVAVRWFTSGEDSDFQILLPVGLLEFDEDDLSFTVGGSKLTGEHLYGYWVNAYPPPASPPIHSSTPPPLPPSGPPPLPPQIPTPSSLRHKAWWKLFS